MKKTKSGISLIVLVITILVLSILAATVIISISNTNVIEEANKTVFKSDLSNYKEVFEMYVTTETMKNNSFDSSSLDGTYKDNEDTFNKIFGKVESKYQEGLKIQDGKLVYETEDETEKAIAKDLGMGAKVLEYISKDTTDGTSPYIGYFADVDGDGTVDGVIFADLAYSSSGTWNVSGNSSYDSTGKFSYDAVATSELKDYVENGTYTDEHFGTNKVLKATGSGADRFYVMALEDITQTEDATKNSICFTWYDAAYDSGISDYSTVTAETFGSGKTNTNTMISKWNNNGATSGAYGARDDDSDSLDMWGVIQGKVDKGWFVPSRAEWAAFAYSLSNRTTDPLTKSNVSTKYGLGYYWSSSLCSPSIAYFANFLDGYMSNYDVNINYSVRLAATF